MKSIIVISTIAILFSCKKIQEEKPEIDFLENEIISLVYMTPNNKTSEEIDDFSEYYQSRMKELEPDVLSWKFLRSIDNKIILIERYKNEDANIITAKNISPNGNRFKLLQESFDFYTLKKVTVNFGYTQKLVDFNKVTAEKVGFTVPFEYCNLISGYSKNK